MFPNKLALFKLKVELDYVQVGDELLYLTVPTLIHLENAGASDQDFLLEDELRPDPLVLVFLVRQVVQQLANFHFVSLRNQLDEVHSDLLSDLLGAEQVLEKSVKCFNEELDVWIFIRIWSPQHLNHVEVQTH